MEVKQVRLRRIRNPGVGRDPQMPPVVPCQELPLAVRWYAFVIYCQACSDCYPGSFQSVVVQVQVLGPVCQNLNSRPTLS